MPAPKQQTTEDPPVVTTPQTAPQTDSVTVGPPVTQTPDNTPPDANVEDVPADAGVSDGEDGSPLAHDEPATTAVEQLSPDVIDAILRDPNAPGEVRAFVTNLYAVQQYVAAHDFDADDSGYVTVNPRADA